MAIVIGKDGKAFEYQAPQASTSVPRTTERPFIPNVQPGMVEQPPHLTEIMGQPHMLAYINPEEAEMLMREGGMGIEGPMGIPAFPPESAINEDYDKIGGGNDDDDPDEGDPRDPGSGYGGNTGVTSPPGSSDPGTPSFPSDPGTPSFPSDPGTPSLPPGFGGGNDDDDSPPPGTPGAGHPGENPYTPPPPSSPSPPASPGMPGGGYQPPGSLPGPVNPPDTPPNYGPRPVDPDPRPPVDVAPGEAPLPLAPPVLTPPPDESPAPPSYITPPGEEDVPPDMIKPPADEAPEAPEAPEASGASVASGGSKTSASYGTLPAYVGKYGQDYDGKNGITYKERLRDMYDGGGAGKSGALAGLPTIGFGLGLATGIGSDLKMGMIAGLDKDKWVENLVKAGYSTKDAENYAKRTEDTIARRQQEEMERNRRDDDGPAKPPMDPCPTGYIMDPQKGVCIIDPSAGAEDEDDDEDVNAGAAYTPPPLSPYLDVGDTGGGFTLQPGSEDVSFMRRSGQYAGGGQVGLGSMNPFMSMYKFK